MLYHVPRIGRSVLHALAAGWAILLAALPTVAAAPLELHGHRGARGLAPENTLAGFAEALAIGVSSLEMDLGVTADDRLVVLHDSRLDPAITRDAAGRWLQPPTPPVRSLTLEQLRRYDVGRIDPASAHARRWPEQRPRDGERIPTLAEVAALVRASGNRTVRFQLETKLDPHQPALTAPPELFARLLVEEVRRLGIADRVTVQSFDWRTLKTVQALAPEIATACLTVQQRRLDNLERGRPGPSPWTAGLDLEAIGGSVPDLVEAAGCRVWSPAWEDLHLLSLAEAHSLGLAVVTWTVNDPAVMEGLVDGGVDGIVTDYPDRLRELMRRKGLALPPATPMPQRGPDPGRAP